jgi:outer membrane protein assembly factor BamD (BamD/ComL family)
VLLVAVPEGLDSCGIAPPAPVFSTTWGPADPVGEFAKGRIGVIRPSNQRRYLVGAYRILAGGSFSDEEAKWLPRWAQTGTSRFDHPGVDVWKEARKKIPGATQIYYYEIFRQRNVNGMYSSYPNCLDDAFATASQTLEARAAKWGKDSANLRDWLAAQDHVFSDCSDGKAIPAAPGPGMDPLLAADREYQIAAAYFYMGEWEKAREAFESVAANSTSPWQKYAPYLIARTYLREGTVDNRPEALREAEKRFDALAKGGGDMAAAGGRLLDFVRVRVEPATKVKELSAELMRQQSGEKLAQNITDFTYLINVLVDQQQGKAEEVAASSDLADWLLTIDRPRPDAAAHSLDRWQKTHQAAWLVAALVHGNASEVVAAARLVRPNEPAYDSAVYYGIAREIATGHRDEARKWADEALGQKLSLSTRNAILSQRFALARNWSEFLKFSPRTAEPKLVNYDDAEVEPDARSAMRGIRFDVDAVGAFNRQLPISNWLDASANQALPRNLQLQIAQAGWVRSTLLDRRENGRMFLERVVKLQPAAAAVSREYLAATSDEAAHIAGILLLLRRPLLGPTLLFGSADAIDLGKEQGVGHGTLGRGSGCGFQNTAEAKSPDLEFLTPEQRTRRDAEWQQIVARAGVGSSYLASEALRWARDHSDDTRAPEALYLAVQATHYGCKDEHNGEYSKQAFTLLHQRYPKSEWAAKTKYWYQ